jgi:endonuclease III related protein
VKPSANARIVAAIVRLEKEYGCQGWWPVTCERKHFTFPRGELQVDGYHPGQFDFPRTRRGRWEICCGAVLTQNTAFTNVRRVLSSLTEARLTTPERLLRYPRPSLSTLIRPAGYFNQKAEYLRAVATWFIENDGRLCRSEPSRVLLEAARPTLLQVRGIGPETADSILLYAYSLPTFVVDAYTRRVFARLGIIETTASYASIRAVFEEALSQSTASASVRVWQEAHALIVEHAKRHHGRGADASHDFLLSVETSLRRGG